MDSFDDEFREPTEDDRSARRIVSLAVALINARHPMTTQRIRREFYPQMSDDGFRKAYQRDRSRLLTAGVSVIRHDLPTGEPAWEVDEEASYADDSAITTEDALFLDSLLLPLTADPSFPYAQDLRLALSKIDRSFDGTIGVSLPSQVRSRSRQLTYIEECMSAHHAAHISYRRADGTHTDRMVLPLGLFPLRGTTYMVASRLHNDAMEEPHVYNLDRVESVREYKRKTYEPPRGFNVRDYIRLPFQLGKYQYEATFYVPNRRLVDVREAVADHGVWEIHDGANVVRIQVADEDAAVTWAISEGVHPMAPASLTKAWRSVLMVMAADAEEEGVA